MSPFFIKAPVKLISKTESPLRKLRFHGENERHSGIVAALPLPGFPMGPVERPEPLVPLCPATSPAGVPRGSMDSSEVSGESQVSANVRGIFRGVPHTGEEGREDVVSIRKDWELRSAQREGRQRSC